MADPVTRRSVHPQPAFCVAFASEKLKWRTPGRRYIFQECNVLLRYVMGFHDGHPQTQFR